MSTVDTQGLVASADVAEMAKLPKIPVWQCHKLVEAFKILGLHSVDGGALLVGEGGVAVKVDSAFGIKHNPLVGGYFVLYDDGYQSFSPAEAFEKGYKLAPTVAHDVTITLTETDGLIQFEGSTNPNKTQDELSKTALGFTQFLANQLPMLVKMAEAMHSAQQQPALPPPAANDAMRLIQGGFKPADEPAGIVDLSGEVITGMNPALPVYEETHHSAPAAGGGDFGGGGASSDFDPAPPPSASPAPAPASEPQSSSDSSSSDSSSSSGD